MFCIDVCPQDALEALKHVNKRGTQYVALKHDDKWVKWEAASALGKLGDPRAVKPLILALKKIQQGMLQDVTQMGKSTHGQGRLAGLDFGKLALGDVCLAG